MSVDSTAMMLVHDRTESYLRDDQLFVGGPEVLVDLYFVRKICEQSRGKTEDILWLRENSCNRYD